MKALSPTEKEKKNGTAQSVAGSWQVQHGMSSPLGVPSTALLYVVLSSPRASATQDMKGPYMDQSKGNGLS